MEPAIPARNVKGVEYMVGMLNKSLAAALLCGAIGLTGTALAQSAEVGAGAAGAETNAAAAGSLTGSSTAAGGVRTGPGQIERSSGATTGSEPAKNTGSASAAGNSSSYGASGSASASASGSSAADKPTFLSSVQSKSTPARGLKGTAMKRVDANERKITAELNRASATSTGNASASSQASINAGSNPNIQ